LYLDGPVGQILAAAASPVEISTRWCSPASTPAASCCRRFATPPILDYRLVVVRDCCADPDAKVHAMLLDIVIAKQAAVVMRSELAGALMGRS
jgi:hypothetical protein